MSRDTVHYVFGGLGQAERELFGEGLMNRRRPGEGSKNEFRGEERIIRA